MSGKAASGGIPQGARRIVQSLKEIVNCPEAEIYATLKECDMNPDEAVNRLLAQGTFREVKSKREKKKEVVKDDPRSRAVNNNTSRSRGTGTRTSYYQSNSNDNQGPRVKGSNVKENDTSNVSHKPVISSVSNPSTTQQAPAGILDGPPLSTQPTPAYPQNTWSGLHGHMSMADVVKMGLKPSQPKQPVPAVPVDRSYTAQYPAMPTKPPVPVVENANVENTYNNNNVNNEVHESEIRDDWSLVEEPQVETSASFENYEQEDNKMGDGQVAISDRQIQDEEHDEIDEGLDGHNDNNVAGVYQSQGYEQHESYEQHEDEEIEEEVEEDFQQLSLQEEESLSNNNNIINNNNNISDDNPAVIIPNHLQVSNADCAHLSFGSFGSGAFSGIFSHKSPDADLAPTENVESSSTLEQQTDAANEEYYNNGPSQNENTGTMIGTRVETLEMASVPAQSESDMTGTGHGVQQYNVPSGTGHNNAFAGMAQQPSGTEFSYPQGNLQNLSAFSSLLQANSLHGSLLAQPVRDFDLSFAPLVSQAMPNKYMPSVPSTNPSSINMQEVRNPQNQTQAQIQTQTPQNQTQSQQTIQTGQPVPQQQHLMHPYSQPTLPLGPFANLISYPFMPQSYTYLPSFQQPYSANGNFHQSGAAVANTGMNMKYTTLPQYKSGSTPSINNSVQGQGSSVAAGYGGFGAAGNSFGGGVSTSLGFDEGLGGSQYKDSMAHYMSLQQQSENPAMWLNSRNLSAMPASTFYNYQGQQSQQHPNNFRQGQPTQQPSQLNSLGYPNFYHSQLPTQDHPGGDSGLVGTQQQQSAQQQQQQQQSSHQLWQNSY